LTCSEILLAKKEGPALAFFVPEKFETLIDDVDAQFRLLLRKQVITGIDELRFEAWMGNFVTPEDRYLAARLLEGLTFRSQSMVCSSIDHLLQNILPCELRRLGLFRYRSIDEFLETLVAGDKSHQVRFVAIDGAHEPTPGKSGAIVIRQFRRHANISKQLTCRPENIATLPDTVKCLVFVDDMVGTGTQFLSFGTYYQLQDQATRKKLLYCPLVAFESGVAEISRSAPWVKVLEVELLDARHKFYRPAAHDARLWSVDQANDVADVRSHLAELAKARAIPASTRFTLDLVLGFEHATPNNTLPIMWAQSPTWSPLLVR
jgi:hypothetical protein